MISTLQFIWPIIVSLVVGFVALRLFGVLSPCIVLNTTISRTGSDAVVLRIEVHNVSRVTIRKTRVLLAIRWVQESEIGNNAPTSNCIIPEWIDFSSAEEILVSTETLYAQEVIVV